MRMSLVTAASRFHTHGPLNIARCKVPSVPAVGSKKTWPANGAAPSGPTARPSVGFLALCGKYHTPLPFSYNWNIELSWLPVRNELTVSLPERAERFSVPRPPSVTVNGAPDCSV